MKNFILKNILLICGLVLLFFGYIDYPLIQFHFAHDDLSANVNNIDILDTLILSTKQNDNPEYKQIILDNTIIIPKIGINAKILESETITILDTQEGVWHEPNTSIPTRGSNMVIAGHRRQFLPPNVNTFFLLPQLKTNDKVIVYWQGKKMVYKVISSFETNRTDSFTYQKTTQTSITLYTCTPLGTAHKRWVVRAELTKS